jgi:long-chain acyl-CoA synthetase
VTLSYADAEARVTAPGERFEMTTAEVFGRPTRVFVHAPPNLRDVIDSTRLRGDDVFCVYEDERWTFAQWIARVDELGAALVERYGVTKGDRVAISMRNYPEWIVSWAATLSVGAIAVSLNAWWTPDEIDFALGDATPKVLIADVERVERAAAACTARGVALLAVRAPEGRIAGDDVARIDRWEDVLVPGTQPPRVEIGPDDDATILFTSGTTGRPKGAVSTHRAIISALMAYGARAAIDKLRTTTAPESANGTSPAAHSGAAEAPGETDGPPDDADALPTVDGARPVFILIVPLFHVTGCIPVMLSCIASGLKLVIMHKWNPERALELIERERVTTFVGVPTQSFDLMQSPRFGDFDTSSLSGVGGGGAPTPTELVKKVAGSFANAGPTIGYGMTETNAYGPQNNGADYLSHPTSTGRAATILDIEARDEHGAPLGAGETGELWMRGPNLIRGYWNRPDATAETIVDGWLRTGDIGHIDDEGFVYVSDRAKDMVLRGGENVFCGEVENALYEHPAIHEAAVFGVPDERLGETVAAAVYLRDGEKVTAEALRAFVAERLAPFKVPDRIVMLEVPLPKNAAGKFLKRQLRDDLVDHAS